jgi:ADP-ribose pyrophosphatase YjhB (NUDIX family)
MRTRCAAFIIKDNKILLIKRVKKERTYWVFPGGGVEVGETEEGALEREMFEETGLKILSSNKCFDFTDYANNTEEVFFMVELEEGNPQIVGIEKERESKDNSYKLIWENLSILENDNVYSTVAREWLREFLNNQQE